MIRPAFRAALLLAPLLVPTQGSAAVRIGATTHFSQGWPARLMPVAQQLGIATIRDSLHWPLAEKVPGRIVFTPANSGHIDRACAGGTTVLLGLEPRNPLYDGGHTAHSPAARAAFARYVSAIAARWPGCVIGAEIGNEINGKGGMTGPASANRAASHVALLKAVREAVKPHHPRFLLLGGSVNTVAGGFLNQLFRAGALAHVDSIAIHPYRQEPEGVDGEIRRVQAAMARAGTVRPIWATEFGRAFARPEQAAPFYLKMAGLMESTGVRDHFWYALADQPAFPTMGLVRFDGTEKPAARAFAFAARTLAPLGPAQRVDHGDPTLFHFRYGPATHVVWGGRRALRIVGASQPPQFFSADGQPLAGMAEVADAPVVIVGTPGLAFGPPEILADSLYGFAQAPLEWVALRHGGAAVPLKMVKWQWSAYLGSSATPGMSINPGGIGITARLGAALRFTAKSSGSLIASTCLRRNPAGGSGKAAVTFTHNGRPVWSAASTANQPAAILRAAVPVTVRAGDVVALHLSPQDRAPARWRYRFRVSRSEADAAPCPEGSAG